MSPLRQPPDAQRWYYHRGRQICHCPECNRRYQPDAAYHRPSPQALAMYCEGSRRHTEGRAGLMPAVVIACDEQWTYRKTRRREGRDDRRIWTAVVEDQDGRVWVDFEIAERNERTFLRLYERLPEALRYCSDGCRVYRWFPQDRHIAGQGGAVNRNKGLPSLFRTQLNRLWRRTKGYTKSLAMLSYSLALEYRYRGRKSNTRLF